MANSLRRFAVHARRASRAMVLTGGALYSVNAAAFCRTTTCDVDQESCPSDPKTGCPMTGLPLYWPDTCVTFGVHKAGSPLRGISFAEAQDATEKAFQSWISAECQLGLNPSIGVVAVGEIECDRVEYNYPSKERPDQPPAPNVNLVVFRDDLWPYIDDDDQDGRQTLALTTITYGTQTGEILDADIEVNSNQTALSTGDTSVTNDLQSILAHEVGHFFGLAHSKVPGATMNARYNVNVSDTTFRTLSPDDRDGICSLYPPGDVEVGDCRGEGPRFGFSRYCAEPVEASAGLLCRAAVPTQNRGSAPWLVGLGALLAVGAARRRRGPPSARLKSPC